MKRKKQTAFAMEVRKKLIDSDMTQVELAEKVGIKPQYLSLILSGARGNSKYVEVIKKVLGMSA